MAFFERFGGLARYILYIVLCFWSLVLFCVCCGRLGYTSHWRNEPSLNGGQPFYDPCVVELLIAAILAEVFSQIMLHQIWYRREKSRLGKNWFEVGGLLLLWLLWLGGAAAASTVWPDLSWCRQYQACVLLEVLTAFSWLGWLTLTILLITTIYRFKVRNAKWGEHHWDAWGFKTFGSDLTSGRNGPKQGGSHHPPRHDVETGSIAPQVPAKI